MRLPLMRTMEAHEVHGGQLLMGGCQKTLPLNLAEFRKYLVYLYTQGNVWYDICQALNGVRTV